jgi:hypothetical protein
MAALGAFVLLAATGCATKEASPEASAETDQPELSAPETTAPDPAAASSGQQSRPDRAQETAAGGAAEVAGLQVDEKAGRLSFGARVAKQDVYDKLEGAIEYAVVCAGGKGYESLFKTPLEPMDIYEAMLKAGMKPGKPAYEEDGRWLPPEGGKVRVSVEWTEDGKERRERIESFILVDGGQMEPAEWVFTGSREGWDPEAEKTSLQVVILRNLIGLQHADGSVLLQNPDEAANRRTFKTSKSALPAEGTPAKIVLEAVRSGPG